MGWVVNATPLALYPRERLGTHRKGRPICTGARRGEDNIKMGFK